MLDEAGFADELLELAGLLDEAGFADELLELAGLFEEAGLADELLELAGLLDEAGFADELDELPELAGLLADGVLLFSPGWGVYFVIDIEAILPLSVTSEVIL